MGTPKAAQKNKLPQIVKWGLLLKPSPPDTLNPRIARITLATMERYYQMEVRCTVFCKGLFCLFTYFIFSQYCTVTLDRYDCFTFNEAICMMKLGIRHCLTFNAIRLMLECLTFYVIRFIVNCSENRSNGDYALCFL